MVATPGLIHQDTEQYSRNVSHVRPLSFHQDQQPGICSPENPQNSANHPNCFPDRFLGGDVATGPITADRLNLDRSNPYTTWPVDLSNSSFDCSDQSGVVAEASLQGFEAAQEKDAFPNTSTTYLKRPLTSTRHIARKDAGLRTCVSCHVVAKKKVSTSVPIYVTPADLFPIFSVWVFHCVPDVRTKQKDCLLPLMLREWGLTKPYILIYVSHILKVRQMACYRSHANIYICRRMA